MKRLAEIFSDDDSVICLECGVRFKRIAERHLRFKHHMTFEDYLERHPGANLTSEAIRTRMCEMMNGENNPMNSPEIRAKMSEVMKKYRREHPEIEEVLYSLENRAKHSETMKTYYEDPENRAKMSETMKTYYEDPENHPRWKGGISFLPYCPKFNESRKEKVRNQYSRTCIISGISALQNGTRLDVDHMDENKMQGCNGIPFRLIPLSHSIHSRMTKPQNHLLLQLLLYGNNGAQMNYMFSEDDIFTLA